MAGFPPLPVYPTAIDSDRTLYLVYNTSEAKTTAINYAWSETIEISPSNPELWADNGFATIDGELFYYDSVEKDDDDKIYQLRDCARNLGGKTTKFNTVGTWVRGLVVAEHHNQLVDAMISAEKFIGFNFDTDTTTLDWRIRNLQSQSIIFDDSLCPDVEFEFKIETSDQNIGTSASYSVNIAGAFGFFEVQFGDGTSSTELTGTHTFAPNSTIDPVAIVKNGSCQVVQTPISRDSVSEPAIIEDVPPFNVPIPLIPSIPLPIFPSGNFPSLDIAIPPLIFPCLDLNLSGFGFSINIPSIAIPSIAVGISISISPLSIPSIILFGPNPLPSIISFDTVPSFSPILFGTAPTVGPVEFGTAPTVGPVEFGTAPTVGPVAFSPAPTVGPVTFGPAPTVGPVTFGPAPTIGPVTFGPAPSFNQVTFGPSPSFNQVTFEPAPSFNQVTFGPAPSFNQVTFGTAPVVSMNWGTPPTLSCVCTVVCPSTSSVNIARQAAMAHERSIFNDSKNDQIEIEYDMVGFPSEIKLIAPDIPPLLLKHDLPSFIQLKSDISFINLVHDLPSEIKLAIPEEFTLKIATLDVMEVNLKSPDEPIPLAFPTTMPILSLAIPEMPVISLNVPQFIDLRVPDDLKVPLVFDGPPISAELKVNWNLDRLKEANIDGLQCFQLVPCGTR